MNINLTNATLADLHRLARDRGYMLTRGPGTGTAPSASAFVDAIGSGELVACGPVTSWADVLSALDKMLVSTILTEREWDVMAGIRAQVSSDANFDDDDL